MTQDIEFLEIGQSDHLFPGSAALFTSQGGAKHATRVQGTHEILYVLEGYLGIREEDKVFVVNPGEAVLLFQDRFVQGTLDFPKGLHLYFVHFMVEPGDEDLVEARIPQYTSISRPERLNRLFRTYVDEFDDANPDQRNLDLYLRLIFREVAYESERPGAESRSAQEHLADHAAALVEQQACSGISTRDVARRLGCHPNYLSRVFKKRFGLTVLESIQEHRVAAARRRLVTSSDAVEKVALSCGFNDERYFRRVFAKHTGLTPREYRRAQGPLPLRSF